MSARRTGTTAVNPRQARRPRQPTPVPPPSASSYFNALAYGTVQAWYSATNPTASGSALSDGTSIATWSDLSGNGRHLTTANGCTAKDNVVGSGTKWVQFGATGNANVTGGFSQAANYSLYVVFKAAGSFDSLVMVDGDGATERVAQYLRRYTNWQTVAFNTVVGVAVGSVSGTVTDANVFSIVSSGTLTSLRVNNGTAGTAAETGTPASGAAKFQVNGNAGGGLGVVASWGELALYDGAHDDTTRTTIERALGAQYGITVA